MPLTEEQVHKAEADLWERLDYRVGDIPVSYLPGAIAKIWEDIKAVRQIGAMLARESLYSDEPLEKPAQEPPS